jgi:alkylated DNA nucleotide flippase Atl1
MRKRKTWIEKLESDQPSKIVEQHGQSLAIPRPQDVDALVRKVRKGRLTTIGRLREGLAEQYGTDTACPLCTGIFVRIVAEAAEEYRAKGRKRITPWWRIVRDNGALHDKFPGAFKRQAALLRAEGHRVVAGRKTPKVAGFEGK